MGPQKKYMNPQKKGNYDKYRGNPKIIWELTKIWSECKERQLAIKMYCKQKRVRVQVLGADNKLEPVLNTLPIRIWNLHTNKNNKIQPSNVKTKL